MPAPKGTRPSTLINKAGRSKPPATEAQKKAIALGKVTGKTSYEVAEQTGLAANTVRILQTRDPRTLTLIQNLRDSSHEQFASMWLKAIASLDKDLASEDFRERHASRGQLLRFATAGEPSKLQVEADNTNADGDITLEELVIMMRRTALKAG